MFKVKIKALYLSLLQYLPCVCPLLDWGLGSSREQKATVLVLGVDGEHIMGADINH